MKELVLIGRQLVNALGDGLQRLAGCIPIRSGGLDVGINLPPDASDPNHEELIPVARDNGQELYAIQERDGGVLGLLQNASIEIQPAQFAIQQALMGQAHRHRRNRWSGRVRG